MADRPIIFSAPMVRALLDGRKTQTRRVLKPQPVGIGFLKVASVDWHKTKGWGAYNRELTRIGDVRVPYAPGDRLWVREAFGVGVSTGNSWHADSGPGAMNPLAPRRYRADGEPGFCGRWRPSIHMPRWASRLTLHVSEVRVQRLQEISAADAVAEGCFFKRWITGEYPEFDVGVDEDNRRLVSQFKTLWNSLHGADAWDANPWVCAITFTVERANIDAARGSRP